MPLIFYPHPKSDNTACECDSITYKNGKDSDICNGFIKFYKQGIVDLKINFCHYNDAY